ncbi:hypothetical protein V490_05109, partial [Pseudogymnoascus sp. VKM F-3557]
MRAIAGTAPQAEASSSIDAAAVVRGEDVVGRFVRRRKLGGQENAWKFELKLDSLGEKLRKKERGGGRERSRGSRGRIPQRQRGSVALFGYKSTAGMDYEGPSHSKPYGSPKWLAPGPRPSYVASPKTLNDITHHPTTNPPPPLLTLHTPPIVLVRRCKGHPGQPTSNPRQAPTMSVTLHTTLGDMKIEVFCESVPKTAE